MKEMYIVGYSSVIRLMTSDREKAERLTTKLQAEFPVLDFETRTVQEALDHAYAQGREEGWRAGQLSTLPD